MLKREKKKGEIAAQRNYIQSQIASLGSTAVFCTDFDFWEHGSRY